MNRKYEELDKAVSKKIMAELKGKEIKHQCPNCIDGKVWNNPPSHLILCPECEGKGFITYKY